MKKKWNLFRREYLFKRAVDILGPYSTWRGASNPTPGCGEKKRIFANIVASELHEHTGKSFKEGGIINKLKWITSKQTNSSLDPHHKKEQKENLIAALRAGFITERHLLYEMDDLFISELLKSIK